MSALTIGAFQVKVRPRPLIGTKTSILATERDMRDWEWSESFIPDPFDRPYLTPWYLLPKPRRKKGTRCRSAA